MKASRPLPPSCKSGLQKDSTVKTKPSPEDLSGRQIRPTAYMLTYAFLALMIMYNDPVVLAPSAIAYLPD
ncbi:hypothetical protein F4801DRAFT_574104 [Xylaria longipes]|nr:hypothetical protein F4801DRAFT_574104 [Xylaria longipes]